MIILKNEFGKKDLILQPGKINRQPEKIKFGNY
jgi:hypothetical protein